MLFLRVASALLGVPIILAVIALGGVGFSIALAFVLVIAALEFYSVVAPPQGNPAVTEPELAPGTVGRLWRQRPLALMGGAFVALLVAAAHNGADWWTGALALIAAIAFLWLILLGRVEAALRDWLWVMGGVFYIGFLGSHLVFLRGLDDGRDWVIVAVFATFATDTSAYFVGGVIGRTRLAPHISPGKTVEGSLGGLLCGALMVVLLNWVLGLRVDVGQIAPLAILLPIAAEIGDLAESLVKRGAGVKDAGVILPGHGGVLDRLDSILFTVVLVYYYVLWVVL